ncbi:sodium/proline symporter PutP [Marinibactrum halimedae]|uniref:Sodium/proline symporter n=1 Tax=Marinibactrum halimedae TaxID=1444977 RepID=A0AA37T8G6_9GAMM|nr:sodium/proline symporter PutP [Marinibactrum halimedae]MCD9459889.1 sodium/proline symporter PutP [Marinibactrum halimedae]GLS25255.1 sodium:proline symporter [Marinibactrum halimedae]
MTHTTAIYVTFIFYLFGMLAIGLWAYRKTENLSDFILGGRRLGPWPIAMSAAASDMSGWLLLGLPGYAYLEGFNAAWLALGLFLGTWANWHWVAPKLREQSQRLDDALTLPEFFANRFNNHQGLRIISAIVILIFFIFYTSSGLVAGGKLFQEVFGFNYQWAVVIGTIAVVSYTLFGGFLAVAWTDLVQGLLMIAALIVVPLTLMNVLGDSPWEVLNQHNPTLANPLINNDGSHIGFIATLSLLAWGLGYFGQPHILSRFKAIHSVDAIKPAKQIAVSWTALSLIAALCVGIYGLGYLSTPLEDSETVFMVLVQALFHPVVAGVLLAAIMAAIMSTADSQLLVASSALTEDIYYRWIKRSDTQINHKHLMVVSRLAVVSIALIAMMLALEPDSKVLGLVAYAWAGFGAAFGPALLFTLYWPGITSKGTLAGIITGGVTVLIWKQLKGGVFDLYEIVPGIVLASVIIVIVSLFSQKNAHRASTNLKKNGEKSRY